MDEQRLTRLLLQLIPQLMSTDRHVNISGTSMISMPDQAGIPMVAPLLMRRIECINKEGIHTAFGQMGPCAHPHGPRAYDNDIV
ncbi:hypothetical protein D3C85_1465840 [compost metagenome]